MNTRTIAIVDMQIGNRRWEVLGDMNELGARILHDDLRHPLLVHDQWTLVARYQPLMVNDRPRPWLARVAAAEVRAKVMEDCRMADMMTLMIDPEFQALIPPLQEHERAQLEANLVEGGCREALVVWQGKTPIDPTHPCPGPWVPQLPLESMRSSEVTWFCPACGEVRQRPYVLLDGHHRYVICQRHAIPFTIIEAPDWVETRDNAKYWIIQNQLGRRNLEPYARVELALQLEPLLAAKAKANQQRAGGAVPQKSAEPAETREVLAKAAGVSHDTMRKVKVIAREADEPTKVAVRQGKRSIHSVYQEIRPPKGRPSSSVKGEGSTAHPPLVPLSRRIGPDASVDSHALAAGVTMRPPGHETAETSVASRPRLDGPSTQQEDLGTPVHRCLTVMGELYGELRRMEHLHDMNFICQSWSRQTRVDYLQQCTYIISRLETIQQAWEGWIAGASAVQADAIGEDVGSAHQDQTAGGVPGAELSEIVPSVLEDRSVTTIHDERTTTNKGTRNHRQDVIARVKVLREEKRSFREIAALLNAAGVATFTGQGRWHHGMLPRLLQAIETNDQTPVYT